MEKKKIRLIAGIIVLVIVIVGFYFGWITYKLNSETGRMKTLATGEIVPGIYAIKDGYSNIYLVKNGKGYIAIDAGNDRTAIEAGLKKLGIAAPDVQALFLTHTDGDHVAAVALFDRAAVYISGNEEQMITGTTSRAPFAPFIKNRLDKEHKNLKDGQVVKIDGATITGILTPGHTPGSMCYIINGENLFTGDTLSLKEGRVDLFNDFFNMDSAGEKKSITRISGLAGIKRIFTAHYGYSPDFSAAFRDWK